jgi:alpha-galactosidase
LTALLLTLILTPPHVPISLVEEIVSVDSQAGRRFHAHAGAAVVLFNESGSAATISTTAAAIGKTGSASYTLSKVWTGATSTTTGTISASVPAHGTVMFRVAGGGGTTTSPSGEIHAVGAGKCLDVPNGTQANGTQVDIWTCCGASGQIWDCNGGANQQWQLNANGTITGVQPGLCLDVTGASTANGALAELWTCNGQSNQQWTLG